VEIDPAILDDNQYSAPKTNSIKTGR